MKHYIIVKVNSQGKQQKDLAGRIDELFQTATDIEGVNSVSVHSSVIDLPNRHDIMICMEMEMDSLPLFDSSDIHKNWKEQYSQYLESKTIFDCV